MIRCRSSLAEIEAAVDAAVPGWRTRASVRTAQMIAQGRYAEASAIWSEVKPVFMAAQHNKCLYCEEQFEGGVRGAIAHDLEHFRPKGSVQAWPYEPPYYPFLTGVPFPEGYYRLAYHLANYAVACKVCNTMFKKNYFPIAGDRVSGRDTPAEYAAERPFLVYPLGDVDEDPAELIGFEGVRARPLPADGPRWQRAAVTIKFFGLNREGLQVSRAKTLVSVWLSEREMQRGEPVGRAHLEWLLSDRAPHASCARAFAALCQTDPAAAQAHVAECQQLLNEP